MVIIHYVHYTVIFFSTSLQVWITYSQAFFILLTWLMTLRKTSEVKPCQMMCLAYDNICNVDRLKIARKQLPLPAPLNTVWLELNKVIDSFHLPNYKQPCHVKYSPVSLKEKFPHANTEAGEQTFVWLGRFKRIVCSMNKVHHLFYMHRMIRRRNQYTAKCYRNGKKPILPKAKCAWT